MDEVLIDNSPREINRCVFGGAVNLAVQVGTTACESRQDVIGEGFCGLVNRTAEQTRSEAVPSLLCFLQSHWFFLYCA